MFDRKIQIIILRVICLPPMIRNSRLFEIQPLVLGFRIFVISLTYCLCNQRRLWRIRASAVDMIINLNIEGKVINIGYVTKRKDHYLLLVFFYNKKV